jgi:hypothetical protein
VAPAEQTAPPPLLELEDEPEDDALDDAEDDPDDDDADDDADEDDDDEDPLEDPDDDPDDPADCPEPAPPDDDPLESESSLASLKLASMTTSPARLSRPLVPRRSEHPAAPPSQKTTTIPIPAYAAPRGGKTLLRTISR